jgi:hypothetical protein
MTYGEQFEIEEINAKKDRWRLTLLEGRLRLEREDESEVHEVERSQYGRGLDLRKMLGSKQALVVRIPKAKAFRLEPVTYDAIERWLPPFTRADVATILRTRLRWTLPIAILFIIGSLPLPGDPAQGIDPIPFDVVGCILGVGLLLLGVLARVAPHRNLLLLDAIWFLMLAADTAWTVFAQGSSPLWLLFAGFLVWVAATPYSLYQRFAATE